ncbi:Golgi-associated RAB2 interactor protein 4 [Physeter macrocephalus]|uniref:Golgi-associated RAB2 interactor protein 4 n=1 Tax=Physeter macrocephalus TaxID=9755 RepID=A0A455BK49_PHYMC|nr:Golgi-associated RAB2 interactor protein 4 [Physeter catodon]|eukprot:XP_028344271.1 protein FAM71A [Physeter catodon]
MSDGATAKAKPTVLDKESASRATTKVETAGVAGGTAAGALSMAVIKSPDPEEQSTAIAATASNGPGAGKTNIATGGTAGNKTIRKAAGPCSGSQRATRDGQKEKGHGSPGDSKQGTAHKGISRAPITNESRTSHKSGRSLSTASSGSITKRLSRIGSFFRNVRANLTTKTVASSRDEYVSIPAKAVEGTRMEAIIETAESGQGLEITGGVTSETMEPVTVEGPRAGSCKGNQGSGKYPWRAHFSFLWKFK